MVDVVIHESMAIVPRLFFIDDAKLCCERSDGYFELIALQLLYNDLQGRDTALQLIWQRFLELLVVVLQKLQVEFCQGITFDAFF